MDATELGKERGIQSIHRQQTGKQENREEVPNFHFDVIAS